MRGVEIFGNDSLIQYSHPFFVFLRFFRLLDGAQTRSGFSTIFLTCVVQRSET